MNRQLNPLESPHELRLGIITNPGSGRNRRRLARVCDAISARPEVLHIVTNSAAEIALAVESLQSAGVELIAINGGDGSVALVLEAMMTGNRRRAMPLLCALPGGTTNVTVNDVGIRGSLEGALDTLLVFLQRGNPRAAIVERTVIGVASSQGTNMGCGLVFGAGLVVTGIEYWQQQVRTRGMRSEFSSGVAMARTLWGMWRGEPAFAQPVELRIARNGAPDIDGAFRLLVVSALERLFLGIHPFWGTGPGTLRFTAIEQRAPGFARLLPGILRGKPGAGASVRNGYHSDRLDAITLDFSGSFTLDGELHHVERADAPITVSALGQARFLRIH